MWCHLLHYPIIKKSVFPKSNQAPDGVGDMRLLCQKVFMQIVVAVRRRRQSGIYGMVENLALMLTK